MTERLFKGRKKSSLFVMLAVTMMLLVLLTIGLGWLMNRFFLERYYIYNKQQELISGFDEINQASIDGILDSEDFDVPFEKICTNGNISILILQSATNSANDGTTDGETDDETAPNFSFFDAFDVFFNTRVVRSSYLNDQEALIQFNEMIMEGRRGNQNVLSSTDSYVIEQMTDDRMEAEYLALIGTLSDGSDIYMRTALESIWESADISTRFSLMAGVVAIIICAFVSLFMANQISQPLKELTALSKRMAGLEFNARYVSKRGGTREIEELGNHMNELSDTLDDTITKLKKANTELQHDIEKKEEIDEMRKEFLSNVSHELKTPLALIQGYAEGLRDGICDDPESQAFYCDVIVDEADKMNQMIRKLLSLNQLEFGNDVADMERFDIVELIQGVVDASSLMLATEKISVEFYSPNPVYVWGDEFKVEEVVTNYLSNAIHYALGEKIIRITLTEHDGLLRTSVFNTGNPIPEDSLDKVWIKFYKVDKARTHEYGGNGIGLSIVKAIMESMNRECGVINHEDGVEFWMELELAEQPTSK